MAIADPYHSASKRIVDLDDLFQILITRNVAPLVAKKEIDDVLLLGKLRIDLRIPAGARKTRPIRQATPEELKAKQAGKDLDFLYEASPTGGTAAVDPQSWGRVLALAIKDGHLIVEPLCGLEFPWRAYSFSISNPVVIEHLWPDSKDPPAAGDEPDEDAGGHQTRRTQEVLKRRWPPYGVPPAGMSFDAVRAEVDEECELKIEFKG